MINNKNIFIFISSSCKSNNAISAYKVAELLSKNNTLHVFFYQNGIDHCFDDSNNKQQKWLNLSKERNISLEYCIRSVDIYTHKAINPSFLDTGLTEFLQNIANNEYYKVLHF